MHSTKYPCTHFAAITYFFHPINVLPCGLSWGDLIYTCSGSDICNSSGTLHFVFVHKMSLCAGCTTL